jgi:integrase/recombinase XerD
MKPSVSILLDKRKKTTTGENKGRYHVKILVTFYTSGKRQRFYYKTDVFATEKEYKSIMGKPKSKELQDARRDILALESKAAAILDTDTFINPELFESKFSTTGSYGDPLGLLLVNAEEMEKDERIGNAISFRQSHSSLKKFSKGPLSFGQITKKWLEKYEKDCLDKGLTITTVGIYLRPLRTVFNQERGKSIPYEMYPFRENPSQKDKYQIPTGNGRKLALSEDQKNKLIKFKSKDDKVQMAVDFWIISYFCNGINFADIVSLRVKNIVSDFLYLFRAKTLRSQRNKKELIIPIRKEVKAIIRKYSLKSLNPNAYLFPILKDEMTPKQKKYKILDFISDTNEGLKLACEALNIPVITTYAARHTFATIALRKGASVEQIQEALGHGDMRTTKQYLDGFDLETKVAISKRL